jgi:hypothetical protein
MKPPSEFPNLQSSILNLQSSIPLPAPVSALLHSQQRRSGRNFMVSGAEPTPVSRWQHLAVSRGLEAYSQQRPRLMLKRNRAV